MSEESAVQRQASVVAVDVVGSAREAVGLARALELVTLRVETAADRHEGRLAHAGGDGFLLEYATPEQAIAAGDEIAKGPRPPVSVGVHHGQVRVLAGGELTRNAVVDEAIALQKAAGPGLVLVSEAARRAIGATDLLKRLTREPVPVRPHGAGGALQARELTEPVDEAVVRQQTRRNLLIGAGAAVVVLGLVALIFGHDIKTALFPNHDHVAVQKFAVGGSGGAAGDFADGLTDEIDYVLNQGQIPTVSRADAESLRGADAGGRVRSLEVGAVLDGSVVGDANHLDVKLHIDDPVHHRRIWEHEFAGSGDDLRAQVSSRVVQVLTCSAEVLRPGSKADDPEIQTLYVKFCDLDADAAADAASIAQEEQILRQVIAKAPEFSYGHSQLSLFLFSKAQRDSANAKALLAESASEADRAVGLDARNADAYVARAQLLAASDWSRNEKNLVQALALPAAGFAPHVRYAQLLLSVGRLNEAVVHAQKAATLSPYDADIVGLYALALAEAGKPDESDLQLTRSIQITANDPTVQWWRFHIYQWVGRWDDAARLLADDANRSPLVGQEEDLGAAKLFNAAMLRGDAASKAAARDAELASVQHDRSHLMVALSHLAALGFVDDAFALTDRMPPSADSDDLSVLFQPLAEPMRRDPRFMALAGKVGLGAYWSASGRQPDFCATPGLAYSCKALAPATAPR